MCKENEKETVVEIERGDHRREARAFRAQRGKAKFKMRFGLGDCRSGRRRIFYQYNQTFQTGGRLPKTGIRQTAHTGFPAGTQRRGAPI